MKPLPPGGRLLPGRLPIVVLIVACVLSAGLAGGGAFYVAVRASRAAVASPEKPRPEAPIEAAKVAFTHSLGETLVNLSDADRLRYAKVTVVVGIDNVKLQEKMEQRTPILRDRVISALSAATFAQLHSQQGMEQLRSQLRTDLTAALADGQVVEVYFDGFVMQ